MPPAVSRGRQLPLVLMLHGVGGNGPKMERYTGFSKLAARDGFVVAYPTSEGTFWNSTGARNLPDDVHFLSSLITYLEQTTCVDPDRVFATGVSNGGGMVALAGCELSEQIAAIAPVAGGYDHQPPCDPARPVSVLEIHGTADQDVPYYGKRHRRDIVSIPAFVAGWAARDECRAKPVSRHVARRTTDFRWGGCAGGTRVEHIKIQRGRHQWPGATPPDPGPPATICASCTIWRFFSGLATGERAWPTTGGAGL